MSKAQHLTKEEELRLGTLVQAGFKAQKRLTQEGLTKKEERECREQIIRGEDAIHRLVVANTGLVWNIAKKFKSKYPSAPPIEDLAQEGMVGLMNAIQRYAPERGNKLSTVATYWIFQSITRWTNKTGRLVKLPENRVTDYTKMTRLRTQYSAEGFNNAEIDERIMKELKLSKDDVFFINGAASIPASLNRKVNEDSDKELLELVLDGTAESAESTVVMDATFQILVDKLSELDEVERDVVLSHFALDDVEGYTVKTSRQVRSEHDLSAAKYKKILSEALENINKDMKEMDLSFEDFISM